MGIMWHARDSEDIFGDIFADGTISASSTEGEFAVRIGDGDRKPVDFRLDRVEDFIGRNIVFCESGVSFCEEVAQLAFGKHVGEAAHFDGVGDLLELFRGCAADAMCRGVRRIKLGVLSLKLFQLLEHHIVLIIRNLRRILIIIKFRRSANLLPQLINMFCDIHTFIILSFW